MISKMHLVLCKVVSDLCCVVCLGRRLPLFPRCSSGAEAEKNNLLGQTVSLWGREETNLGFPGQSISSSEQGQAGAWNKVSLYQFYRKPTLENPHGKNPRYSATSASTGQVSLFGFGF